MSIPLTVVVKSGNLGVLGWLTTDTGTAGTVFVDIVAEVDGIVGITIHYGASISV